MSQLAVSAIPLEEIVAAWFRALEDPSGEAMVAFHCDRLGIPNAGVAQPITQAVLERARREAPNKFQIPNSQTDLHGPTSRGYDNEEERLGQGSKASVSNMESDGGSHALTAGGTAAALFGAAPGEGTGPTKLRRVAGLDTGPRCWLWVDEVRDAFTSEMIWAELIASGNVVERLPLLMEQLRISCVLIDAGGEPDLTKRLCLTLNGLESYQPPALPPSELVKLRLCNIGTGSGLSWDGEHSRWHGLRAAAVLFCLREARGIEQTIGFTQDGKIYPLIKCNRAESIQTAVNDFLTPAEGVIELVNTDGAPGTGVESKLVRQWPRARLLQNFGPGVTQALLDTHLLNLRKVKVPRTGEIDWIEGVENHLGLAKVYARLAQTFAQEERPPFGVITSLGGISIQEPKFRPRRLTFVSDRRRHG